MAFFVQFFLQELVQEVVEVAAVATTVATVSYVGYKTVEAVSDIASSSSSSSSSGFYLGRKTIWDWWGNGLNTCEYDKLKDWGYDVKNGCFSYEEVRTIIRHEVKAPGKPTKEDGFEPKKGWDGETLVREPHGPRRGYPDKDGNVWVPTGKGSGDGRSGPHGGPHWDVEYPNGGYRNVRPKKK